MARLCPFAKVRSFPGKEVLILAITSLSLRTAILIRPEPPTLA